MIQRLVVDDGIGRHVHFRHARAFRPFIADDNDGVLGILPLDDSVIGRFFRVEDQCLSRMMVHFRYGRRVFDDPAVGGDIALHDGDRAVHFRLFRRRDDVFRFDAEIAQMSMAAGKEIVFPELFQIFAQSLARTGHDIEIQLIPDQPFHHGHAAGHPEHFPYIGAVGLYVDQMLDFAVHFIKYFRVNGNAQFVSRCRQVNKGIGTAAECGVDFDGIHKGVFGHDLRCRNPLTGQIHDGIAGRPGIMLDFGEHGRHEGRSGQSQSQCFRHALHGAGRPHKLTDAACRAVGKFVIAHFFLHRFAPFFPRTEPAAQACRRHIGTDVLAATGNVDRRQVQPGRRDEMGRYRFVTARQQDQTVPGNDVAVDFHEIGNDFPAEENVIHAIVTFGPAIADICCMEPGRLASAFQYTLTNLFGQDIEMITARVAFPLDIIDENLQLVQIPF